MALPVAPNTTCDIYRDGSLPPAAPDVAGVACFLTPDWRRGREAQDQSSSLNLWTHVLLVALETDVRDGYTGNNTNADNEDQVFIPDQNGTRFRVCFVERVGRGGPYDHKRVYLDRWTPNWPSNDL